MKFIIPLALTLSALAASPALGQNTDTAATNDMAVTNTADNAATTAAPEVANAPEVAPTAADTAAPPAAEPAAPASGGSSFPWGVLGLIGLAGLLGSRKGAS